jgi:hypothetical protein
MFSSSIVWRGIVYTILMMFGKLVCGLWLVRLSVSVPLADRVPSLKRSLATLAPQFLSPQEKAVAPIKKSPAPKNIHSNKGPKQEQVGRETPDQSHEQPGGEIQPVSNDSSQITSNDTITPPNLTPQNLTPAPPKPISLYPPSILGLAMVARGEIGFLISSLAESNGIFSSTGSGDDEVFLIVTWAIVLCTVIGPVGVGLLVRRLKRLEKEKGKSGGGKDVLGVWGVG